MVKCLLGNKQPGTKLSWNMVNGFNKLENCNLTNVGLGLRPLAQYMGTMRLLSSIFVAEHFYQVQFCRCKV